MGFVYESIDSGRFQQLCQALLVKEYPGVECWPVGMPDGGQDAVIQNSKVGANGPSSLVFQIKQRRPSALENPSSDDLFKWLKKTVNRELTKIQALAERGAEQYILMTNVPSTSHPRVGLRARVQAYLDEKLPIHAWVMYREDLDRRLEGQFDLIVEYGLATGPTAIRAMFETLLAERGTVSGERGIEISQSDPRINALLLFVADQMKKDSRLRFKQTELDVESLLNIFVDVPLSLQEPTKKRVQDSYREVARSTVPDYVLQTATRRIHNAAPLAQDEDLQEINSLDAADMPILSAIQKDRDGNEYEVFPREVGGASFLLAPSLAASELRNVVIEGAPGQGKSTLGQYVCQVHRLRILDDSDVSRLPKRHQTAPLRLPFRVDLRDFSVWLDGLDPFDTSTPQRAHEDKTFTLEGFLAFLVRSASGGASFSVDDFFSIVRATPSLVVLDGLDEVADIRSRERIVSTVTASVDRLNGIRANVQVVITSRPNAFSNSPGFPRSEFPYLSLQALPKHKILVYTDSWLRVRDIDGEEAAELKRELNKRLGQPHIVDLARNPMQLAILLWLMYVKGYGLPDKRTSLYEEYLSTFLNREVEKSPVVRKNRDLLLELHGVLAWKLHAEAEQRASAGNISEDDLKTLFFSHLQKKGHKTDLVDELFRGVQRVLVLVSRIEGTFEFEVQPLREFFAARFLYKTAPHASPDSNPPGTRPERLIELLRRPYWLNVTRFFCGFYDEGELADLNRRLTDLRNDPALMYQTYPSDLIALLLRDWVFTRSPRDSQELIQLLMKPMSLRMTVCNFTAEGASRPTATPLSLPRNESADQLVRAIRDRLGQPVNWFVAGELGAVLRANEDPASTVQWWLDEFRKVQANDRPYWLRLGYQAGVLQWIDRENFAEVEETLSDLDEELWFYVVSDARAHLCSENEARLNNALKAIGRGASVSNNEGYFRPPSEPSDWLAQLSYFTSPSVALQRRDGFSFSADWMPKPAGRSLERVAELIERLAVIYQDDQVNWRNDRRPYQAALDALVPLLGECWSTYSLALVAGTVSNARDRGSIHDNVFDAALSLSGRFRFARLENHNLDYWLSQLALADSTDKMKSILVGAIAWLEGTHLVPFLTAASMKIDPFTFDDLRQVNDLISNIYRAPQPGKRRPSVARLGGDGADGIAAVLLHLARSRLSWPSQRQRVAAFGAARRSPHHGVYLAQVGGDDYRQAPLSPEDLPSARIRYKVMGGFVPFRRRLVEYGRGSNYAEHPGRMSRQTAHEVLASANEYSRATVVTATFVALRNSSNKLPPLGRLALDNKWLSHF